jgi:hypothetical protein
MRPRVPRIAIERHQLRLVHFRNEPPHRIVSLLVGKADEGANRRLVAHLRHFRAPQLQGLPFP